jgi:hypothetical protein
MVTLLRVEQLDDGAEIVLRVGGPLVATWPTRDRDIWRATESTVLRLNAELTGGLDDLRSRLRDADVCKVERSQPALGEFVRSQHGYWTDSDLDRTTHQLNRIRLAEALRRVTGPVRALVRSDPLKAAKFAPTIDFVGSRRSPIPVELLPIGERPKAGEELLDSCLRLPAFFAVFRHLLFRSQVDDTSSGGKSLVAGESHYIQGTRAYLRSEQTVMWKSMGTFFASQAPRWTFDPAPLQGVLDTPEKVARYLLNPGALESPPGLIGNVSDIHIYAHGGAGESRPNRFTITFRYGGRLNDREFSVRSIDFEDAMAEVAGAKQIRPLIWFNCCKAGGAVGRELFSLSVDLANSGCNVIAPRTETPEGFSNSFAQDFYRHLAAHPSPGAAFLAARLQAVTERQNPLGLLYIALSSVN